MSALGTSTSLVMRSFFAKAAKEMISTSAIRVSCVVDQSQVEQATQALHAAFGLAKGPALVD